jgi:hypothetical protein
MIQWPKFLDIDSEIPDSIPGATRFSEKRKQKQSGTGPTLLCEYN